MRQRCLRCALAAIAGLFLLLADISTAQTAQLTDEQVRDLLVAQSLRSYPGNCPCPYNVDRAGRLCGKRSAWSKPGGASPLCYATEVSSEQIRAFRAREIG